MEINKGFQNDFNNIVNLLKAIKPDITDTEIDIIKIECKSMVSNMILSIGNNINSQTSQITL